MKKAITTLGLLVASLAIFAGGIVTNTNQSASFIRMPARDATLGIDAVYYNPAAMSLLKDGFHLSINNQSIWQTRLIENDWNKMNRNEFEGGVTAPLFPSVYAVYKKNRLALALAVNPIGGGGSALFEDGLPSLEMQPASLPLSLSAGGVPTNKYSMDVEFEGKSIIWGFQGGASYKVNEMISLGLGLRYLTVKNSYTGYLKNLKINPRMPSVKPEYDGNNMVLASTFFTDFSAYLSNLSGVLNGTGQNLQPIIAQGGGNVPLAQGTAVGLTPQQVAQLQGTIQSLGGDPTNMTIAQAQAFFFGVSNTYAAQSQAMAANATATSDKELDAVQKGSGIVPVIGIGLKFSDNLNIGIKYEHRASMKVKNETKKDDVNMFPDGAETPNDMPSMLAFGVGYSPFNKLKLYAGGHYYFDRSADYGKKVNGQFVKNEEVIDKNLWEAAAGFEYSLTQKLLFSAGYLRTQTGVNTKYQSDISHSLSTNSVGLGFRYDLNDKVGINLGAMNTWYISDIKMVPFKLGNTNLEFKETYKRSASVISLGIDISL